MADRVSASIVLGGTLSAAAFAELAEIIANEGLSIDWDGEPFEPEQRAVGQPLNLYAHEVAWGIFETLERWCAARRLPFTRWSGGYGSEWGAQRVISTADGTQTSYAVTEDDEVMVSREVVEKLGDYDAILAHFEAADFVVPPLVVEGDDLTAHAPSAIDPSPAEGSAHVE